MVEGRGESRVEGSEPVLAGEDIYKGTWICWERVP